MAEAPAKDIKGNLPPGGEAPPTEEAKTEAAAPATGGGGVSMGMMMGMMGGFLVLTLAIGFGASFYLFSKIKKDLIQKQAVAAAVDAGATNAVAEASAAPKESEKPAAATPEKKEEGGAKPAEDEKVGQGYEINELLVNVAGTRGARYCKVTLFFDAPKEVMAELTAQDPRIRDVVSEVVSSKSMDELTAPNARGNLRSQLISSVNTFLKKGQVTNIYFLDFIIQ